MIVTLSNLFPEAQMALRAERIAEFISDRLPESGVKVQLLCEDHVGTPMNRPSSLMLRTVR